SAFTPTKITLEAFDDRRWEFVAPSTSSPLSAVISRDHFQLMFPSSGIWNYDSFIAAAASLPAFAPFGNTGDLTTRKREVAAFLANVAHETSQLTVLEEVTSNTYCSVRPYGCPAPEGYRGRGPLQLSHNYNYYAAGNFLGRDLLSSPTQVATTPSIGWQAALWFWMFEAGASYGTAYESTAHASMTSNAATHGFLATIRAINGSLECGKPVDSLEHDQRNSRIEYYNDFVGYLGTTAGTMNNAACP
ncbi:MAG TPA: chitinase, partial [Kofleriaceae bacterium]|nr:chitinase [Kofleriaceae bacterium]